MTRNFDYNVEYFNEVQDQKKKVLVRNNTTYEVVESYENVPAEKAEELVDTLVNKYNRSCKVEFNY